MRIADFGLRIFWIFFFNPHSEFRIPHLPGVKGFDNGRG